MTCFAVMPTKPSDLTIVFFEPMWPEMSNTRAAPLVRSYFGATPEDHTDRTKLESTVEIVSAKKSAT